MSTKISVTSHLEKDELTIAFQGKIDSSNAPALEEEIQKIVSENPASSIVLDFDGLEYTTSAGLRVILRLRQQVSDTSIVNASPEVYDILEMTGFTDMMEVQKRELARTAFVAGIPTAIPYDVVRIKGGGYGSVFELLNAESYASLLKTGKKSLDEIAEMSIDMLKLIHSKTVKEGTMPDMKEVAQGWAAFLKDYLPAETSEKLVALVDAVPKDMHMMHGDYHVKNVMLQNGESLLIDMDTLCYGHPIFELASMFNAYRGYSELDHSVVEGFLGIPYDTAGALWRKSLELYLDTKDDAAIQAVEDKAKIIGFTRIMRRSIRRNGLDTDEGRAVIENCKSQLIDLVGRVDTLLF